MRLSSTEGGEKRRLRRIIRITRKGFADDWSYGAAMREKVNQTDSGKCISKILAAQAGHQTEHREVCG